MKAALSVALGALMAVGSMARTHDVAQGKKVTATVLTQGGKYWMEMLTSEPEADFWHWDKKTHTRGRGKLDAIVAAKAEYSEDRHHPSGFGSFRVSSNPHIDDNDQAFAAGFAEGALTSTRIYQNYLNMRCQVNCNGTVPDEIADFFISQTEWTRDQIAANPDCHFWKTIGTILAQFEGMLEGYNAYSKEPGLERWALDLINGLGDLFDIKPAVMKDSRPDFESMGHEDLKTYLDTTGHCSAIVKAKADLSDLFIGHSSWFSYSSMLRIFKIYELNLQNPRVSSRRVAFSSYPGMLVSLDDFYMMSDSGLMMVQTTNPTLNVSLWDMVLPESLLAWHRVRAANTLATDGQDWYKWVSKFNSGTYNNQYMVIDWNRFKPKQALPPDTLWVVEQIPGLVRGADVTAELERSYWPSFNVPYFQDIYAQSGFPRLDRTARRTVGSQYEMAPRAQIFRRDHGDVHDLQGLMKILRDNDYVNDPLSDGNPFNAICARGDLARNPRASGCYDTKVTNRELFFKTQAWVINGPTAQSLPAFSWSSSNLSSTYPHHGQPDTFDFRFELMGLGA